MGGISKTLRFVLLGDDKTATKALKGVGSGFRNAFKDAKGFAGKSKMIGGALLGIGIAAVAAGAAIAVKFGKDSVNTFKRVAGETRSLSRITGLTAEESSRLGFAFKRTGIDAATGAKSMGIFAKNVVAMSQKDAAAKVKAQAHADAIRAQIKALEAAGPKTSGYADKMDKLKGDLATATAASHLNASALGALGVKYTDAHGKLLPMKDLLPQIADKFASMPDGAEKSAAAMKLFGKGGLAMLPFLNKGAAGLKELGIQSDKTGNTMSGKQLDALKKNKEEQRKFDAAMQGLSVTLGSMLLPLLTQGAEFFNSVFVPAIQNVTQFVKDNQGAFDGLGNMMRWFWNSVLLPVLKFWISANAQTAKGIGVILEATGKLTGNKDLEAFGKGIQNAADATTNWANSLQGIPDPKPVVLDAKTPGVEKVKGLDTQIKKLHDKIVTAKANGVGGQKLQDMRDKLAALRDKRVEVTANVKKTGVSTIKLKDIGAGGLKISAYRGGGRPPVGQIAQFHKDEFWVPDTMGTVISQARSRQMSGSGPSVVSGGGRGSVIVQQFFNVPPNADLAAIGRVNRDSLLALKGLLGGRGLGLG